MRTEHVMTKVLRGYAKDKNGDLILIGAIPALIARTTLSNGTSGQKTLGQARRNDLQKENCSLVGPCPPSEWIEASRGWIMFVVFLTQRI
jgi:hypothetical protein